MQHKRQDVSKPALTGRPSIFRSKDLTKPVRGYLTAYGKQEFREARIRLAGLVGWKVKNVTTSDVVEYVVRGEANTITYLKETGQIT